MSNVVWLLVMVLAGNAIVSFGIAFFWQAKVILSIFRIADRRASVVPWRALANPNSPQNMFGRFWAGEILPDLRRKWLVAITYTGISFAALFVTAGALQLFAPGLLP